MNHDVTHQLSESQVNRASSATSHSVDQENNKNVKRLANLMRDVMIYTHQVLPSGGVI
jgi:hypothetical protein